MITGFALLMCACIVPVNIEQLLEDEKVQEIIIKGNTGAAIDIEAPEIEDHKPLLEADKGTWTLAGTGFLLSVSAGDLPVTVTVSNASDYTASSIKWYCNDASSLAAGVSTFTIMDTSAPFNEPGVTRYTVTVEAEDDLTGIPYSTWFTLVIN